MDFKLYATCPNELTPFLAEEIKAIGGKHVKPSYRVVYFEGDETLYYKAHLHLRLASRVCRIIKDVPCHSPTIVFDKLKKIRFHELFSHTHALKINVTVGSNAGKIEGHLIGSKIREAINDSFAHFGKVEANQSSWEPKVIINGFYYKNRLMLSLDTSMKSLHKRGYRVEGHPAPLKETLAAALLHICEYKGQTALLDPMSGSGSLSIEGAQIALNKAPMIHRKKGEFGFEYLNDFNNTIWRKVQDDARAKQKDKLDHPIFSRDISSEFQSIAKEAALKGRVEKFIDFKEEDFFTSSKPCEEGILIANIPYGKRLDEEEIGESYLRSVGDHLKQNFKGWKCGILVPTEAPYKKFGLKPSKRLHLKNGMVDVVFLVFDMY